MKNVGKTTAFLVFRAKRKFPSTFNVEKIQEMAVRDFEFKFESSKFKKSLSLHREKKESSWNPSIDVL